MLVSECWRRGRYHGEVVALLNFHDNSFIFPSRKHTTLYHYFLVSATNSYIAFGIGIKILDI
jgi:hypothetical protein